MKGPRVSICPSRSVTPLDVQVDRLSGVKRVLSAVAMAENNPSVDDGIGGYPGNLAASMSGTTPGSPARNLSQLGDITQPPNPASQQPALSGLSAELSPQLQGKQ